MLIFMIKGDLGKERSLNTTVESVNWFNLSEEII